MSRRKYDLRSSNNACIYISLSTEINVKKPLYLMFVSQGDEPPQMTQGVGVRAGVGSNQLKKISRVPSEAHARPRYCIWEKRLI